MKKIPHALFLLVFITGCLQAQRRHPVSSSASGGPLRAEQAAYNVTFYDLSIRLFPEEQAIAGTLTMQARMVHPSNTILLHLDTLLTVDAITDNQKAVAFRHTPQGELWLEYPMTRQPGEVLSITIRYHGNPRVAPNPPWVGGFVWSKTPDGQPWIGVACQMDGADLWWPAKDHPSDEPDSMALHITVPEPLVAASNGRLRGITTREDGTRTYHWFISVPINNYDVTLNVAPYVHMEDAYTSITGEEVPMHLFILPEHEQQARDRIPELKEHLRFFEQYLGPYPFRADKYGLAEAPYLGMEHQSLIAYGYGFKHNAFGYDWLHHHELAHEWWGNMVTAYDWRDFWIHEGFGTYMQPLYVEQLHGKEAYLKNMLQLRAQIVNKAPVAPRQSKTTREIYFLPPDYTQSNPDIYYKGAWILHTLRYLLGDATFFQILRRMSYPRPEMERLTDGRQCRFATTDDFLHLIESTTEQDMDWFFEVYLRQPFLPRLIHEQQGNRLFLRWEVPGNLPFPMPVEVSINGEVQRIALPAGTASVPLPPGARVEIDPHHWLLRAE